jgi:hypothetical protein
MLDRQRPLKSVITQPVRCTECQAAVTLHVYERWNAPIAVRSVPWMCPYCRSSNHTDVTGRLTVASRGYPDPDPDRPPEPGDPPGAWLDARCPTCHQNAGRRIKAAGTEGWVIYLCCRHCGSTWTESTPPGTG